MSMRLRGWLPAESSPLANTICRCGGAPSRTVSSSTSARRTKLTGDARDSKRGWEQRAKQVARDARERAQRKDLQSAAYPIAAGPAALEHAHPEQHQRCQRQRDVERDADRQ